jgi:nicotine blue oxidoreductase
MTVVPTVGGLLLAAGAGRRYGMPKALVRHGGSLLVERAFSTLRGGGCDPVVLVLGAAADEVRARADLSGAAVVVNPDWSGGMGSSLRVGLGELAGTPATAAVVLLVDTPGITSAAVARLVELAAPDALAVATYQDQRGHPVLLGRSHWTGAAALAVGDMGAREYLRRHTVQEVPCDDIAEGTDLDRPPS